MQQPEKYTIEKVCHVSFDGGSATTPALSADGSRIYIGDSKGMLMAVDQNCQVIRQQNLGGQIIGSVTVSIDNNELPVLSNFLVG